MLADGGGRRKTVPGAGVVEGGATSETVPGAAIVEGDGECGHRWIDCWGRI